MIPNPIMVNKHFFGFFSDQFQCINSNNKTLPLICINKNLVCDGTEDCPNGLDEKQDCPEPDRDCGIGKYYCPSLKTCLIICDSNSAATCPEGNLLKGIDIWVVFSWNL